MRLRVQRRPSGISSTIGELCQVLDSGLLSERWCYTLEDVVRERPGIPVAQWKIHGSTAIPEGTYRLELTPSARFNALMPQLIDVPGFTGIRIHTGNTFAQTEGCLLVGLETDGREVTRSRPAYSFLFDRLMECEQAREKVWIEVRSA